jgi:hypothetical protein
MHFRVTRLPGNPIITPELHPAIGHNIQGPSLIRVPDWVTAPLGRYYLYFADHKGDHIRLAFADALEGPWRIHPPGALCLADSRFPVTLPAPPGRKPPKTHIASPDLHADHANRRLVMYFHGLHNRRAQCSRVATSADGLHWDVREELLGPSYFRVFRHRDAHYAVVMPGKLYRSTDGLSGFEEVADLFGEPNQRHTAVLKRGEDLLVFWTRVTDAPESILVSRVALAGDCRGWWAGPPETLLRPETEWEGAALPVAPSIRGAINVPANQLRDPCIFEEGGRVFLLYAVAGESGIGLAELTSA